MIAKRLCTQMAAAPVETAAGLIPVPRSLGVAALDAAAPDLSELLNRADMAVYAAKHGGRNQVAV